MSMQKKQNGPQTDTSKYYVNPKGIWNIHHHPVSLPGADEAAGSLIITLAAHTFGKVQTNHKNDDCDYNSEMSVLDFCKHLKICWKDTAI